MTELQINVRLQEILDRISDLRDLVEDLQIDVNKDVDRFVPFSGQDDLTEGQKERRDAYVEARDTMSELDDKLRRAEWDIYYAQEGLL